MNARYRTFGIGLLLGLPLFASAHVASIHISQSLATFPNFFYEGIRHIIPLGLDHILFIATVFFLSRSIWQIISFSLMFTVAHSVTLSMVALGLFVPPGNFVEPVIALSIFILAVDLIRPFIPLYLQGAVIFFFGLFHGMGFADALLELGLPDSQTLIALLGFNIGVEVGQLTIIFLLYFFTLVPFKEETKRTIIVRTAGYLIAVISGFWVIERIFF